MAEYTQLENLSDHYLGDGSQSDAATKFIYGEISLGDYLQQMGDQPSTSDLPCEKSTEVVPSIDALSIGNLDDIELSESSGDSDSDNETNVAVDGKRKSRSGKRRPPQRSKLSATLKAMMGQANVSFAKGDAETAVKMCFEIIKEEPNAPEPFRLLSNIYENNGEAEKALQMRLFAAHLGPTDPDEWIGLAAILKNEKRYKQAAACFTRAIHLDSRNVALYENRMEMIRLGRLGTLEDYGYQRLLHKLDPKTDGPTVIKIRNLVGTSYCTDKKYAKACEIWKYSFENCKELIKKNEIDLYTDALLYAEKYDVCLSVLCEFCAISVTKEGTSDEISDVEVRYDAPTDIRVKLALCLVHHRAYYLARTQIELILKDGVHVCAQFFYNIAAKLVDDGRYHDALSMLNRLAKSRMNSADIWFKITSCYKNLNELDQCLDSYRIAISYFPNDNELKLKFCNELKSAGMYDEAVQITFKDQSNVSMLIYERCQLYYLLEDHDAFIEAALQLFRLHCIEINGVEEFNLFESLFHRSNKGLKEKLAVRLSRSVDTSVSLQDEWEVFRKVCNIYLQRKDYDLLQHMACSLCLSIKFIPKRPELRMAMIVASIYNQDYELGCDLTRPLLLQAEVPKRAWNLFYSATYRTDYSRVHKFLIRMLIKNPNEDDALMLYANSCLVAGTYKYALNDYSILSEKYQTPLLSFMVALNLLHIACQKFTTSKHALVTQMLAFLTKYKELRGNGANQEVFYNFGRAFHQLELLPQAIFYYKKALTCKPPIDDPMFDLTADIAYNLHLIYLNASQFDLAKAYLQKYVII